MVVVQEDREQADVVAPRLQFLVGLGADRARRLGTGRDVAVGADQFEQVDRLELVVLVDFKVGLGEIADRVALAGR